MSRVLLTGVSGFLGWHLAGALKSDHEIAGTYRANPVGTPGVKTLTLDLRDKPATEACLARFRPEVVIHTAAVTNVRFCEDNPQSARECNFEATVNLCRAAEKSGARVIFTSTDRVFDGSRGNYTEQDPPDPLDVYGRTKLAAERAVSAIANESLIVRLPLMFGLPSPAHSSFVGWMLEAFQEKKPLHLFTDQYRTPLYVGDACDAFRVLLSRRELSGLFHLGGRERINRVDFGYRMAEVFEFDPAVIRPLKMSEKAGIPPCPADVSLNSDKFFEATGFRARPLEEGLADLKDAWSRGRGAEDKR